MELVDALNKNQVSREFLSTFCKKNRIKYKYEKTLDRLLFYTNANIPNRSNLTYYCNGMICEQIEGVWEIVCYPLPNLSEMKHFDRNVDYHVYPVYESSIINLYYSKLLNKWCYGTKKSFNIFDQTWRGVEYSSVLEKIEIPEDKDSTYVFSVSDERLHIFGRKTSHTLIGKGSKYSMEFFDDLELTVDAALDSSRNALRKFLSDGKINLGFIFRSPNSSILCETDLMKKISRMVYKPNYLKSKTERELLFKKNGDLDYIIAKCYVNDYGLVEKMFPQFLPKFKLLKEVESKLIEFLIRKYERRSLNPEINDKEPLPLEIEFEKFNIKHQVEINLLLLRNNKLRTLIRDYVFKYKDLDFLHLIVKQFN